LFRANPFDGVVLKPRRKNHAAAAVIEGLESRQLLATGLQAVYYNNSNFTGASASRVDAAVNFNFATTPPPSTITPSSYSVRWTGTIQPLTSESYIFYARSDDGLRLWVNHKLLIDHWKAHTAVEDTAVIPISLATGNKYDIQIEYWNGSNPATAVLSWSSPNVPKEVVPSSALSPAAQSLKSKVDHAFSFAEQQYNTLVARLGTHHNLDAYAVGSDNVWTTTGPDAWTSGLFAGSLWQIYAHNTRKQYRLNATAWTTPIGPYKTIPDDIGFRIWPGYFPMAGSTKLASDKQVLKDAANAKLTRFNSTVGMFRTAAPGPTLTGNPNGDFLVIIDQGMDMEPLYWASKETGITTYRDRANAHLLKMAQNFVRADGSTLQMGYYNSKSGAFVGGDVKQAYSANSTWSR